MNNFFLNKTQKENDKVITHRILKVCILSFISFLLNSVYAGQIQVNRYQSVSDQPLHAQQDLLSQPIEISFPSDIVTLEQAITYLLKPTGYEIVTSSKRSKALNLTLSKLLPLSDRHIGPMSIRQALLILTGSPYKLIEDPIDRKINFKLKANYKLKNSKVKA